jgi:hypothetical protein
VVGGEPAGETARMSDHQLAYSVVARV